MTIPLN
ncbi:hypothetical protein YPPY91_2099, partial [Yersinia pestis PY-91]